MKEYWLDFSGYMKVRAENEIEAEQKFWDFINNYLQLSHTDFSDDVWDLDGIEEVYNEEEEASGVKDATSEDWDKFWEGR